MLKSIDYTVTFKSTLRTLKESINFQAGFGTITGPNESGKSFVVEMVRWCLFGASALRGAATEYSKAKATLRLSVKGVDYVIERSPSAAKVLKNGMELAVGTTPTNNKVVEILGFGLQVFDVACIVNQGEVEALGSMKPAQRKRMVDSVVGLGVIDDMGKYAGEEATTHRQYASELLQRTKEPEAVVAPDDYRPSAVVQADLEARRQAKARISFILGRLSQKVLQPTAPKEEVVVDSAQLSIMMTAQTKLKQKLQQTKMELTTLPTPSSYSLEQLDLMKEVHVRYNQWVESQAYVKRMTAPTHTHEQITEIEAQLDQLDQWTVAERLRTRLVILKSKGVNCCPSCDHEWAIEAEAIAALEAELAPLSSATMPQGLSDTRATLAAYKAEQVAWEAVLPDWRAIHCDVIEVDRPALSLAEIESHQNRNGYEEQRVALKELEVSLAATLNGQPDYSAMYNQRVLYEGQYEVFRSTLQKYLAWAEEEQVLEAEKATLQEAVDVLPEREAELARSLAYEQASERYADLMRGYLLEMEKVEDEETQASEWDKVKVALVSLKGLVKQHLMPSLNKVASYYLSHMTGGQRRVIFVDEEFNVSVDGQALHTLSGSGKAVANLSLRIGLGQILTNNVLSLFVGDEIDASMDKDRAEHTALTLQTLKGRISQILLVTHRLPTADYYITVGNANAEDPSEP